MLMKFGFVSPSELADFKHFHFHRNQQRDSQQGTQAHASYMSKGTRWFVMKHILVRK